MNGTSRKILTLILTGVLTVLCCIGLLLASSLVPQDTLWKETCDSAEYFVGKPLFEYIIKNQEAVKRDNYADCITTGIAYYFGDGRAVAGKERNSAFIRILQAVYPRYDGENVNESLYNGVKGNKEANITYSRYWHGNAAFVRFLLPFLPVFKIRAVLIVLGMLLNLAWMIYLIMRKEYVTAVSYLAGILAGKLFFAYGCMEYAYVGLIMVVLSFTVYVWYEKYRERTEGIHLGLSKNRAPGKKKSLFPVEGFFLIGGILTCFFDFLTAETLTFTVPVFVLFTCMLGKKKKGFTVTVSGAEEDIKKHPWKVFIVSGICWLAGYGGMFGLKWLLARLFLGKEEADTALLTMSERMVGAVHETANIASAEVGWFGRMKGVFERNLSCLFSLSNKLSETAVLLIIFGIIIVILVVWFFLRKKDLKKDNERKNPLTAILIVTALIPVLRFIVLSNHAYNHAFFTYRALMVTVMIVVYFFIRTTVLRNRIETG